MYVDGLKFPCVDFSCVSWPYVKLLPAQPFVCTQVLFRLKFSSERKYEMRLIPNSVNPVVGKNKPNLVVIATNFRAVPVSPGCISYAGGQSVVFFSPFLQLIIFRSDNVKCN